MDVYTSQKGHKRYPALGTCFRFMNTVVIQNTIVDPLTAGPVVINCLPLFCSMLLHGPFPGTVTLQVDGQAIGAPGAFITMGTLRNFLHNIRAAVLIGIMGFVKAGTVHLCICSAYWFTGRRNGYAAFFGSFSSSFIEVDNGIDRPVFAQLKSCLVITGAVQAEMSNVYVRI